MRKIVKLSRSYKGINPGEIAGFDDYEADALIAQGAAELVRVIEAPAAEVPAEAPAADKKPGKKES
jgi:hypothetical protein